MKILITGGAGFIGSHLAEACLRLGHRVVVVDDLSVGRLPNLSFAEGSSQLQFEKADVAAVSGEERWWDGVDRVFHLAARADIVPSIQMPLVYHRANVDGTVAVLEAARKNGVKRFIYAASSSCYGLASELPTPESASLSPQYPYALTKLLGEQYVLHWAQVYGLSAVSLRFFNVYGPRARTSGTYGAVFGVFLAQKLKGLPFTIVGDGKQTRDFTYVTDVVDALLTAADSSATGDVFNVGSGGTYSVNELVALLGGDKTHVPKRPGEPDSTFADIRKIGSHLGWRPRISFPEGVKKVLAHIDDWADAPLWTPESISTATLDWFKFLSP